MFLTVVAIVTTAVDVASTIVIVATADIVAAIFHTMLRPLLLPM
jgi:hypothetical protein